MKTILFTLLMLTLLGQSGRAASGPTLYTCGMHPQIIQDHPGNCPLCGMKLTPIHEGTATGSAPADSQVMAVDAATRQNMNLRTAEIRSGPLRKLIRTVGTIDYNETAQAIVTTKFKGWVEKLEVDATGRLVHRGEPMFEIYAPELYSAEAEYLLALEAAGTNPAGTTLQQTAAEKLRFLDVPEAQITELEHSRKPRKTLPVTAPISGFVIEKQVVAGQMVEAGMPLYRLADLGIVWVFAQIYEQDLAGVQLGQEATVKVASLPDRVFRGRVTFIYPSLDEKTRTARVRLEFENPGYYLKPGMFVSIRIAAELKPSAVLVPESAVLRSGEKNTVFVALDEGKFTAREVRLGADAEDDQCEVLAGLKPGERVVTSGQFLLDSESQLREAIDKMKGTNLTSTAAAPVPPAAAEQESTTGTNENPGATVYVCPMPEHVSIVYDHPGNCPICGMALVPVSAAALARLQPGGRVLYYTCPMPEHASVHLDQPGKCPLCGMTLIPVMAAPETPKVQQYYCPMHPEVKSDEPGQCPKCGMDLVPVPAAAK